MSLKGKDSWSWKGGFNSRDYWLQKQYGITETEYDAMLKRQNFKCAICGSTDAKARNNS